MSKSRLPAKLSRPHLFDAVERERLFAQLDVHARRPITWLAGPPGSGKTTLVTSYLAKRQITTLWYRVDQGDDDAATIFSYLAQGARAISRKRRFNLPALTVEQLPDIQGHTRRFFRALFDAVPASSAVVLDCYENANGSAFNSLLAIAAEEVPPGCRIIVTCRERPPAALAHLQTKGSLALLLWKDLQLTETEAREIAGDTHLEPGPSVQTLHRLSDGWAAGFVALLEHARHAKTTAPLPSMGMTESLFAYFVNEMFALSDEATRRVLMLTALMPAFTLNDATALCPDCNADVIVHRLYRQHYFIDRSAGAQPVYHYHALFRDFLLEQARTIFTSDDHTRYLMQAGGLLAASGRKEEALTLFIEASAWDDAARVICDLAPTMLDSGRNALVTHSINALPPSFVNANPWLGYWRGMARLPFNPQEGRALLEAAFFRFEASDDATGCVLSSAGIIEGYYFEWGNVLPVDRWARAYDYYSRRPQAFPSVAIEIRTLAAFFAVFFRGAIHADLIDRLTARALELISMTDEPALRIMASNFVGWIFSARGNFIRVRQFLEEQKLDIAMSGIPPSFQIPWQLLIAWQSHQQGKVVQAFAALERAETIARTHGIRVFDGTIASFGGLAAAISGDSVRLETYVDRMRKAINPARALDAANHDYMLSVLALSAGDIDLAIRYATSSVDKTLACGATLLAAKGRVALGHALLLRGDHNAALAEADRIIDEASHFRKGSAEYSGMMLKAGALRNIGNMDEARSMLRKALAVGRANEFVVLFPWVPARFMQQVFAWALEEGIEVDYVRQLIQRLNVPAPTDSGEHWPWRVRIYTLGAFAIMLGEHRLEFSRKQPKRPLALLKLLLSRRGQVRVEQAIDALWANEEVDAAANALDSALHRLRRMLGGADMVELQDGVLRLHTATIWVDAFAFEAAVDTLERNGKEQQELAQAQALKMYRGHFLAAETSEPWSITARERLRARYIQIALAHGQALQSGKHYAAAKAHYERAIEIDELVEGFYVGLMQSQLALGRRSEGASTYERLRKTFEAELKLPPGPASEQMRQTIYRT